MQENKKTFRFDDVCLNSDPGIIPVIIGVLLTSFPGCHIILGVSPLVNSGCGQRVFPKLYNAISDPSVFYNVDACGIPDIVNNWNKEIVSLAGHGLIHVDHRLLDLQAQEMSIVASCSLVKSKIFIPPFNKWNTDTEIVCEHHGIKLIKFEDGWLSMEHNFYREGHDLWYLHAREWTLDKLEEWLKL